MNRTFAWLGGAVALLAAGLAGAWLATRDAGSSYETLGRHIDALERRVADLEGAHAGDAGHARVAPAPAPAVARAVPRTASSNVGLPAPPAPGSTAQATRQQDLRKDYEREPRDAAWAASAEHALTGAASAEEIANANLVPAAFEGRCKSRRCRIVARFPTRDQAQEWGYYFMTRTAGTLRQVEFFIADAPGGGAEITLYGHR